MRRSGAPVDVVVAWCVVVALAIAGYGGVVAPAAGRTRATIDAAHDRNEAANRNLLILANAAALDAARTRVARDLRGLNGPEARGSAGLAILRLLRAVGAKNHVVVTALSPAQRPDAGPEADAATIVIRGLYASVLHAVAALSRGGPVVEVRELALVQTTGELGMPEVEATIGVAIFRRITPAEKDKGAIADEAP